MALPILTITTVEIPYTGGSQRGILKNVGFPYLYIPVGTSVKSYIGPRTKPVKYNIFSSLLVQ